MDTVLCSVSTLPLTGLIDRYRKELTTPEPSRSAVELLQRFQPYLQKWIRLLAYGRWDRKDREIKHFLQMMGSMDIEKTVQIVSLRLKAYEKADIEQEVILVFLETAGRAKSIRRHFRYSLQKRIVKLLSDPLVFNHSRHIEYNEVVAQTAKPAVEIDELWVAGFTCGNGFDELTPDERKVLQLHYHQGLTIDATAKALEIGTATVSRVISKAKRILCQHYRKR